MEKIQKKLGKNQIWEKNILKKMFIWEKIFEKKIKLQIPSKHPVQSRLDYRITLS